MKFIDKYKGSQRKSDVLEEVFMYDAAAGRAA